MQDDADEERMARLLPMIAPFERAFRIDQDVGDILDVAHFLGPAPHGHQRVIARAVAVGRIEPDAA